MKRTWATAYLVAAVIFGALDAVWLTQLAGPLYAERLGDLVATDVNVWAAVAFYAVYVGGITYVAVAPALCRRSGWLAVRSGAVLGFVAYSTWVLTNLAVLAGFTPIVMLDLVWGTCATAVTAGLTYAVCRRLWPGDSPDPHP